MKKILLAVPIVLIPLYASSQVSVDEMQARFINRTGSVSEDRRTDEHAASSFLGPGPKTGCHGDTVNAGVTITNVKVNLSGNVADITATYNGKYTRQGWITPCIQSPPPNGHEDHNVYGQIHFTVKQIPFKPPEISWDAPMNVGEVGDPNHDSNIMGAQAAKNALLSAM
ncbi:hypothetical protein [Paraburkholderia sp. C35]|uniref:hypothetical protein n=1 Tax=Paraburkholderia sp. C35 TaxID=2126993 RepID=UPI0013A55D0D|nr:hypothetical protein [Paraburkholderia sp. C35]